MTDYAWPAGLTPSLADFRLQSGSQATRSPLSGSVRSETVHPAYWLGSLSFTNLTAAKAQQLKSYAWRVDGASHRALVPMFGYQRQGAGGGTPRVNGASQTGFSLVTDGWPVSALVLRAGDRIGVASQAFEIAADATTNGSGQVTLVLSNEIRTSPANDALIETTLPIVTCIVSNVFGMPVDAGYFSSGTLEVEEAYP